MKPKIVLVTAGGHISCFHAAMKRMHEVLEEKANGKFELCGAMGGIIGLIEGDIIPIHYEDIEEDRAGSLIGCDRKIVDCGKIVDVVKQKNIHAIIMMGGDNHLGEASKLYNHDKIKLPIVGYPKTMDFDLSSFITLGYETAVTISSLRTREHHNSALTSGRVFYVGLFGRDTDWTLCGVTGYGGGDRGIPGEQEYKWNDIWARIRESLKENKERFGKEFAVVPYVESVRIAEIMNPPKEHLKYDEHKQIKFLPEWVGMELVRLTEKLGNNASFQVHSYDMRDSNPTETDKKLSQMAGEECMEMILAGDFGKAVCFKPLGNFYRTSRGELADVAKKRFLKPTGYFDYKNLVVDASFYKDYGDLFRQSLGFPPSKCSLVYRNMLRK